MSDDVIEGMRFQSRDEPDVIFISPKNISEAIRLGADIEDIIGAAERYLINKEGFSPESFVVTPSEYNLTVKVKFIDDGYAMAKIQGIII